MRRTIIAVSSLALVTAGAFVLPTVSQAVSGTGVYGVWSASGGSGEVTFPGTTFPSASFTSIDSTQTVAKSQTLIASSPFGLQYGSSRGATYLLTAVASGQTTGSVTLTFDSAPIAGTWGLALGDVDAENVTVTAKDSAGRKLNMNEFFIESFNTATGQTDTPTWNPRTETLMGSGTDTTGASAWFTPSGDIKTITLTQKKLSGFPQYALWIATDLEQPTPVASATSSSAAPSASASVSASPSPTASPTIPAAPAGKIVICHRTMSKQNPYVRITISQDAVIASHDDHDGGLYPTPGWGDIIPPFAGFAGKNWPAGGAILDNDCDIPAAASVSEPTASASASASASNSGSSSESASASASGSASASPSSSASSSASASSTATATASASPSATASASSSRGESAQPTSSASASPTATISAEIVEPLAVPFDEPTAITVPDIPNAPVDAVISDVEKPKNGEAVVTNGEVVYTPNNGFVGTDAVTVILTDRDGNSQAIVVPVVIGDTQTAVNLSLPSSLSIGTTVLTKKPVITNAKQIASVTVECSPMSRSKFTGDLVYCHVKRKNGGVSITVTAPMSVKVTVSAPAKGRYLPLNEVTDYRVR
jgi:hypothetical protein